MGANWKWIINLIKHPVCKMQKLVKENLSQIFTVIEKNHINASNSLFLVLAYFFYEIFWEAAIIGALKYTHACNQNVSTHSC